MNEYDVAVFFDQVIRLVVRAAGLDPDFKSARELLTELRQVDTATADLLDEFFEQYRAWFEAAKRMEDDSDADPSGQKAYFDAVNKRDAVRRRLVERVSQLRGPSR